MALLEAQMKIVLSPSKNQMMQLKTASDTNIMRSYLSEETTNELLKRMRALTIEEMSVALKCSEAVAKEAMNLYRQDYKVLPAYQLFTGTVFKQLKNTSSEKDIYNKIYVFSALYGFVSFLDHLHPYRLDMNNKLTDVNLYKLWEEPISHCFEPQETVLCLASKEYERMIPKSCQIINVLFCRETDNGLRQVSGYEQKVARGTFLNYIIEKNTTEKEILVKFNQLGYAFSSKESDTYKWVFVC